MDRTNGSQDNPQEEEGDIKDTGQTDTGNGHRDEDPGPPPE
ncbi:hypothetical protein ACWGJ2_19780 [Streptomyces sp. NPDC054796]